MADIAFPATHRSSGLPLEGLRVVAIVDALAASYCVKMLVDAGADAMLVEAAEGSKLRSETVLFGFLAASTRSIIGSADDVPALSANADVVVHDGSLTIQHRSKLASANPQLVIVSVSAFGTSGPWADRPATDLTVQAASGTLLIRGTSDRPPVQAGGRIGEWAAGVSAALGTVAALRKARLGGVGTHVDVSTFEASTLMLNAYTYLFGSELGITSAAPPPPRWLETPGVEATSDGYVGLCCNTHQQSQAFWEMVGRPEMNDDPEMRRPAWRAARRPEALAAYGPWLRTHTTAEVLDECVKRRVPAVPVCRANELVDLDPVKERGLLVDGPGGCRTPRVPYRISGVPLRRAERAPKVGAHTNEPVWSPTGPRPAPSVNAGSAGLPLLGLRVLDLTTFWAGPVAGQAFGFLGADVIKVEGARRIDGMRLTTIRPTSEHGWWDAVPVFHGTNTNKRGITLDLSSPEGQTVAWQLIERADLIVENFTPRVVEQFGLTWDLIHERNPRAVMVRMPAYGLEGSWRDRPGFAQNLEQVSGMAWVTGFPDGDPMNPKGPCDPLSGVHAAFAGLLGLEQRDRTGVGCLVESAMLDTIVNVVSEQVLTYEATGEVLGRMGNRSRFAAPQGLYACEGTERWLAISVATDEQWRSLCEVLGSATLSGDTELVSLDGRVAQHDRLDGVLAAWCAARNAEAAEVALIRAGVPASVAVDGRLMHGHPQLEARQFFNDLHHPVAGTHGLPGFPFRFDRLNETDGPAFTPWVTRVAPCLGEHNDEVLAGELGLTDVVMNDLRAKGVIGDRPID